MQCWWYSNVYNWSQNRVWSQPWQIYQRFQRVLPTHFQQEAGWTSSWLTGKLAEKDLGKFQVHHGPLSVGRQQRTWDGWQMTNPFNIGVLENQNWLLALRGNMMKQEDRIWILPPNEELWWIVGSIDLFVFRLSGYWWTVTVPSNLEWRFKLTHVLGQVVVTGESLQQANHIKLML